MKANPSVKWDCGICVVSPLFIHHDMEARELKAKSFSEFFETYVSGVIAGKYVYAEEYGGIVNADDV